MTVERPYWARTLVSALALAMLALTTPQFAFAAEDEAEEIVEEIVVTGSRIKRSDFSSSSPITVVTGQSILESGFTNLGEALRNQAVAGTAGFNQSSILSGAGASSLDLRNLGPDRVLILINGKRVASFADALVNQAADLSFVPTAMVERVDILRDGASAIYGSDAISGVVNVILKERFEGVEAGAMSGISSEGDGEQYNFDLAMGATSDRGSIILGMEYRYNNNINQTDRDWAFPSISDLTSTGATNGSPFQPGGLFLGDAGELFCTTPPAFGGDGVTLDFGCPALQWFGEQAVTHPDQVQLLAYDYGLNQDLITQHEVYSTSAYGVYEIFDGTEVFIETQYAKRQSLINLDGNPGSFGTPSFPAGTLVPANNPNLPAGFGSGLFLIRPTDTIGPRTTDVESDVIRIATGLRGEIIKDDSFFNNWSWELSYLYTRQDAVINVNSVWNLARFIRIADPALCAVDALCSQVVNPSGALDVLRPGNWTQDEIEYMRQRSSNQNKFQTSGWLGMMTGPIFELPAGEVQVAFGFETRTDRGFSKPDTVTESGESVANQVFTTRGSFDVEEYFAEIDIPLLSDVPGFQNLDLNIQWRLSDYSTFGEETVERFGLDWQIIDDLRVRANISTAYRAPSIRDLFSGGTGSFDFFTIPCANAQTRADNPQVEANCTLDGAPTAIAQAAAQFAVVAGGNPDLEPETADTSTIGLVITPRFIEGLSVSIDYWDVEVDNLISRLTADSIVDSCYFGAVGLTDPSCNRFDLGQTGAGLIIQNMTNRTENLSSVSTDGFDLGAQYEFEGPWDTLISMDLLATYVRENTFYPGQGGADDRGSIPRIRGNYNVNVSKDAWDVSWRIRYIHGMNDPRFTGDDNVFGYSDVPSHTEHDLRIRYNWDQYTAVLGVNDVFDRDPPYVFSSGNNTDVFLYSPVGRYFFLRLQASL